MVSSAAAHDVNRFMVICRYLLDLLFGVPGVLRDSAK